MMHDLIKTGDSDVFAAILDRNNEVALSYCRVCCRGEGELATACPGARCFCNRDGDFVCTACLTTTSPATAGEE